MLNYVWGVEIKMSKHKGRGLFASEHIKKGDLLIVEKAIAVGSQKSDGLGYSFSGDKKNLYDVHDMSHMNQVCNLAKVTSLRGVEAMRVSTLYDGTKKALKCPPITLFTERHYNRDEVPDLSVAKLQRIVALNTFSKQVGTDGKINQMFCLKSYLNHDREKNLDIVEPVPNVNMMHAARDIEKGEELCIDYAAGLTDEAERNEKLEKYGIVEGSHCVEVEEEEVEA